MKELTIEEVKEDLGKYIYGKSREKCLEDGICIDCGEKALLNCYSDLGIREYKISALCEKCWDKLMD